jgi:acyl-CoA synthetase (AMP-forming)/AMP-acid ligase II
MRRDPVRKTRGTVALLMSNCPAYVAAWLGASRCGASVALINTNQRGRALEHSLEISGAEVVIVEDGELADALLGTAFARALGRARIWVLAEPARDVPSGCGDLAAALHAAQPGSWGPRDRAGCRTLDAVHYIYTSGTTGLPKAAKVSHFRFMAAGAIFSAAFGVRRGDRIYCALPLYHSSGGMIGVSTAWEARAALVIRPKFSATAFFPDCIAHGATVALYIGELCRYLLATPESAADRAHGVRVAIGNGLNRDTWQRFQQRFGVARICEFYGATEGNATLLNTENRPGAVGITTPAIRLVYPVVLAALDPDAEGGLRRDPRTGLVALEAEGGSPGELLGKIIQRDPSRRFDGYRNDARGSRSKVVCDVVRRGDRWFRSGDILQQDTSVQGTTRFD